MFQRGSGRSSAGNLQLTRWCRWQTAGHQAVFTPALMIGSQHSVRLLPRWVARSSESTHARQIISAIAARTPVVPRSGSTRPWTLCRLTCSDPAHPLRIPAPGGCGGRGGGRGQAGHHQLLAVRRWSSVCKANGAHVIIVQYVSVHLCPMTCKPMQAHISPGLQGTVF